MACILYKEGNSHTNRGVKCEAGRFPVNRVKALLEAGWVTDPRQLYEVEDAISEDEQDQTESSESSEVQDQAKGDQIPDQKVLSSKEVREQAKLAGVEGWDTARIKTLKEKLGYE
jgi:hypothetical protein